MSEHDRLLSKMNEPAYEEIPQLCKDGITRYVTHGCRMGHFLTGLFSNDLRECVSRADDHNKKLIWLYVRLLCNCVPNSCHGSFEKVRDWSKKIQEGGKG